MILQLEIAFVRLAVPVLRGLVLAARWRHWSEAIVRPRRVCICAICSKARA